MRTTQQNTQNPASGAEALSAQTTQGQKISVYTPSSGVGTAKGIPSNTNPFVASYGDYFSLGDPRKYAKGPPTTQTVTFGTGIYTPTTSTSGSQTATTATQQAHGFTTYGTVRNPAYATVLSDDIPLVVHTAPALQSTVRAVIDRSTYIKSKGTVGVTVTGNTVELSGVVGSDRERRTIEGMVRMTPGVRDVQNLLQVAAPK